MFLELLEGDIARRARTFAGDGILELMPCWKARFLTGGPGSGKTYCIVEFAGLCAARGLCVMYACLTGKLAQTFGHEHTLQTMTLHRGFSIGADAGAEHVPADDFSVWLIDEVSMITKSVFDCIMARWYSLQRYPVLVFIGDFHQLPPIDQQHCGDSRDSLLWRDINGFDLGLGSFRSDDSELLAFQSLLRHRHPTDAEVHEFFSGLTLGEDVTSMTLQRLWSDLPAAVVLTATVASTSMVNAIALELFGDEWLCSVRIWVHIAGTAFVDSTWLRRGTRICISRNWDFARGLVNGTEATVLAACPDYIVADVRGTVEVLHLRSSYVVAGGELRSAFDVVLGYAMTVHKAEGSTLAQVCIVFEDFCPAGWAYTAVTRARALSGLAVIGSPRARHFCPRS
jgi:hypothetical protein